MQDLVVRPEYRRQKVAAALIAEVEREAQGRQASVIQLEVSVDDTPARRLYEKCGYVSSGREPRHVDGTVVIRSGPIEVHDLLLTMEKRLGAPAR